MSEYACFGNIWNEIWQDEKIWMTVQNMRRICSTTGIASSKEMLFYNNKINITQRREAYNPLHICIKCSPEDRNHETLSQEFLPCFLFFMIYCKIARHFCVLNTVKILWFRGTFRIKFNISSSSCRATSTDIPDPLSPLLPIVHRLWQVFRATSRILTELLYVCPSWSSCFCSAICGGPIGVHRLWARLCFSSSVLHVWFVYSLLYL